MNSLPVVAAIPNYNMANQLKALLPQLINEKYTDIFVLDDASTDNSKAAVNSFGKRVTFVAGDVNLGAGGNRNRINKALKYNALIHFLDADTELETKDIVGFIHKAIPSDDFGFVGGLVKDKLSKPLVWNYGPRPGLKSDVAGTMQYRYTKLIKSDEAKARSFHKRYSNLLKDWPDPLISPVRKQVYWCSEANMVVNSKTFAQFNGFDPKNRESEISDLAIRMNMANLKSYFDPSFVVRHTEATVRTYNRRFIKDRERWQLAFRYGIRNWLLSTDKYWR